MTARVVRSATEADVPGLNDIYNAYIVGSHVSFDTEPWTEEQRRTWYRDRTSAGYPVLVAEAAGDVLGAAWSGPWRDKAAYRPTVETTVVLAGEATGAGLGTELLAALLADLTDRGFRSAIAVIALPNDASIAVHRKLGYREVGTLPGVGVKDGTAWDTTIMQRDLRSRS